MICLSNINKYYHQGKNAYHALKNIDLVVRAGEFVAIMGQSGSGKSTLINIIGFLDDHFDGDYTFEKKNIAKMSRQDCAHYRNRNVGFVFQNFKLINNLTVKENIAIPLLYAGQSFSQTEVKIEQALDQVGLRGYQNQYPLNLSGGQQQRVSIARALINKPKFLIADEPTGALDSQTSKEIISLFTQLNLKSSMTIIMVTHDLAVAQKSQRIIRIMDGTIASDQETSYESR
ncbi:ABC transporter ATP-binding protein [Oenococcus sp. UCMA 16435]|nr:ABC transporter ATP-binding protein [Oenococcus sp. UCMA 16435]MDI4584454.1 ATP-binding cassette domain-containing protein [Oenococcus sp. UCMA 14587]